MDKPEVLLRALEPQDLDVLFRWENNPSHWAVTNTLIPFSRALLQEYITAEKDLIRDRQFRFVMVCRSTSRPVGFIDLFEFDPLHLRAGIGILIGSENDREKGYAAAGLTELIRYCKEVLMMKSVYCNILPENTASVRLFEKLGFSRNGKKENWIRTPKGWSDEYFYQLQL